MRDQIIKALIAHAQGDIQKHVANVEVYLTNPAGIGEHSDVMCLVLLGGSRVAESRAGADISYLSAFPGEAEVLFPVCCCF